jgi:succinate dehydrogenase / fumarate reductase, cytochrome b subunit
MAFGKYIGWKGVTYRGGGPMLTFLLHRITALGIILFVGMHILASFSMQQLVGGDLGTTINIIYESWWFQIFVVFCVIFHTFNGLRITILDFFPKLLKFQREAIWLEWAIFIPLYALTVFVLFYTGLIGG